MQRNSVLSILLLFIALSTSAQHTNVLITTVDAPNEPSIMIDPKNPLRMMAANNIWHYHTSEDGGFTWEYGRLTSLTLGVWGDPCIVVDTLGNFYFFHLSNPPSGSWIDRIVCQRTDDMGQTWTQGSSIGFVPGKATGQRVGSS
jgi:hypothetical protein